VVEVEGDRVVGVEGDRDHPLTRGFTCVKGRRIGELHASPNRIVTHQRRRHDGTFEAVPYGELIAEVAGQLTAVVEEHGPDSVALFIGTQSYTASLTHAFLGAWFRALGSRKLFSTMTIDQSAKWVAGMRLGGWAAGRQRFEDSDVWLFAGTNPLVSMQGGELTGFPVHDGHRRLAEAKERGLRLVVVDPRRTELAAAAAVHLQLRPGTDAVLFAALLHVVLRDGLHDGEFCDRWVSGLDELRAAVAGATPSAAAEVCGVEAAAIEEAARIFGSGRRGMATSGTGPDMGPWANLAEHLLQALNVVCGRFPREGDRFANGGVLRPPARPVARVLAPRRMWERGYRSRTGWGQLYGQLPSASLPAEILEPGDDRVRALVVVGGNPAAVLPEPAKARAALAALDVLVTIDPFWSDTARLATHVVAPAMALERPDHTRGYEHVFGEPFAQYTEPVLARPGDVVEDWELFFDLGAAMDLSLVVGSTVLGPGQPKPTSAELLAGAAANGRVPYDEVRRHPSGHVFDGVRPVLVGPAPADAVERFELLADDVADELGRALAGERLSSARPFRLVARRSKEAMNSLVADERGNPARVHPDDLGGSRAVLTTDHGAIEVDVETDDTLRPGTVSLTHARGNPNVGELLSLTDGAQSISAMPWLTAVPVTITWR
jgi:anaerobic selenocysteine-containing dehydrogenase